MARRQWRRHIPGAANLSRPACRRGHSRLLYSPPAISYFATQRHPQAYGRKAYTRIGKPRAGDETRRQEGKRERERAREWRIFVCVGGVAVPERPSSPGARFSLRGLTRSSINPRETCSTYRLTYTHAHTHIIGSYERFISTIYIYMYMWTCSNSSSSSHCK